MPEKQRKIMHAVANMSEMHKVAFICQTFGMFEMAVDKKQNISPEKFYEMAAEFLDEFQANN